MPLWHSDKLTGATKTVDVGLIKDYANPVALRKGIQIDLPRVGDDTTIDIEHVGVEPIDDVSILATTTEPDA